MGPFTLLNVPSTLLFLGLCCVVLYRLLIVVVVVGVAFKINKTFHIDKDHDDDNDDDRWDVDDYYYWCFKCFCCPKKLKKNQKNQNKCCHAKRSREQQTHFEHNPQYETQSGLTHKIEQHTHTYTSNKWKLKMKK